MYSSSLSSQSTQLNQLCLKRIAKDLDIIHKNVDDLNKRGIYVHINESNITRIKVLVIPEPKSSEGVESPYTYGHFVFEIEFTHEYPMSPPKVTFHPQQNMCRLHPNYYNLGKVCLSVINTWAGNDWTPTTSILSLLNILEERFNEKATCFEPTREGYGPQKWAAYNSAVEYAKYIVTILEHNKYEIYSDFKNIILANITKRKAYLIERARALAKKYNKKIISDTYGHTFQCDYDKVIEYLENTDYMLC
jgi:ubiquitin-protein ligase